jgi:hypothetical protein
VSDWISVRSQGYRRIVPQTGGLFTGPEISGKLAYSSALGSPKGVIYDTYLVE